ncbi:hypothetical protein [Streptosporangium sp. NPDC002524]|uniref:hypothetical protein n=1 Tax=Streptosporangium sp. NPDC002524 TaxID=3154537 RepID=UPI003329A6CF
MSAELLAFVRARVAEAEHPFPPGWLDHHHPPAGSCPACEAPAPCRVRAVAAAYDDQFELDHALVGTYAEALARHAEDPDGESPEQQNRRRALELAVQDRAQADRHSLEFRPEWAQTTVRIHLDTGTAEVRPLGETLGALVRLVSAGQSIEQPEPGDAHTLTEAVVELQAGTHPGSLGAGILVFANRLLDEAATARGERRADVWRRLALEFAVEAASGPQRPS